MTIELAPKAAAPHKAQSAGQAKLKAQHSAHAAQAATPHPTSVGDKADASGDADAGGGFMAILSAQSDASVPSPLQAPVQDPCESGQEVAAMSTLPQAPDSQTQDVAQVVDAANLSGQQVANAPATTPLPGAATLNPAAVGEVAMAAGASAAPSALASAPGGASRLARMGGAANAESAQSPGAVDAGNAVLQRPHLSLAKSQAKAEANAGTAASDTLAASGANGPQSSAAADARTQVQQTFDLKLFAAMQEARGAQNAVASQVVASGLAKAEKPGSERAEAAKVSYDTSYSATPLGVSSNPFSVNGAATPVLEADLQAAQQIQYWISQDVQNAELKLDGLGEMPVSVSIQVHGNEAHVAFRTDELQTRGVLERAGEHLKDMLAREGLLLSGVSVGSSGADSGDGQARKPRQGLRQASVGAAPVGAVEVGVRRGLAAGRSLDLFV